MGVKNLQIHVGQDTGDLGSVAISIAYIHVARVELPDRVPIIALSPAEAREVATLILVAADHAEQHGSQERVVVEIDKGDG